MNILVIGAEGMLGHEVFRSFCEAGIPTQGTTRTKRDYNNAFFFLDLMASPKIIIETIQKIKPTHVINCTGILKPLANNNPLVTVQVNSLAPHILAMACSLSDAKLFHISTDGVYDGKKGNYSENDSPSPPDFYGTSKLAGEVCYGPHLTIRVSIIGYELRSQKYSLLNWFLQNNDATCNGYTNHLWNGVTTTELASFLLFVIQAHSSLSGMIHFYGETVNKYKLLYLFKEVYHKNIEIYPFDWAPSCDRTLHSTRFSSLGYSVPSLKDQLITLKKVNP